MGAASDPKKLLKKAKAACSSKTPGVASDSEPDSLLGDGDGDGEPKPKKPKKRMSAEEKIAESVAKVAEAVVASAQGDTVKANAEKMRAEAAKIDAETARAAQLSAAKTQEAIRRRCWTWSRR